MTQRTDVGDKYPSVTASGVSHGKGSTGPHGEAETPKGMCMWASAVFAPSLHPLGSVTHVHPHTRAHVLVHVPHTCVNVPRACTCAHSPYVHSTPYMHKSAHMCTAHSIHHTCHPCTHVYCAQTCTQHVTHTQDRVFSSRPSAELSLPCAASSPGLVSVCVLGGDSSRSRSFLTPTWVGGLSRVPGKMPSV